MKKKKSFKHSLQVSYVLLISIMVIPTIYSIIVSQNHTKQYDDIITNVSNANRINQIAKNDIPTELWDIVCGRKSFSSGQQYNMIQNIFSGIDEMQKLTKSKENKEKLKVAYRACTTLLRNIEMLEAQMKHGSTVTANETSLDEIRTISALFSDIMQDFILSEIDSANETNSSIKISSITLTILQILIILSSIAISIHGYLTVSSAIREPLSDMQDFSTQIANGNLSARIDIPDVEELTPLAVNMNSMAEQIDVLIKSNIEEQKNFQKAEMKALQAQITPHFLYNTFDTIIWLAEEEKTDEVVRITKAFSDFLRISLSRGHEWITIGQELDHIKNYLTIQKIRYADILNYEIVADPCFMDYKIIKLVLQPLVENAIYHGIKNKRGRGHLKVTLEYAGDAKTSVRFTVEDDGAGFTPERLIEVQKELNLGNDNSLGRANGSGTANGSNGSNGSGSSSNSGSEENLTSVYGLYNVNKKLKLYYGDKTQGLIIQSEHNKGSTISFVIPCSTGDEA